jgi:hypothetical protein
MTDTEQIDTTHLYLQGGSTGVELQKAIHDGPEPITLL